jgi:hypothetical protein
MGNLTLRVMGGKNGTIRQEVATGDCRLRCERDVLGNGGERRGWECMCVRTHGGHLLKGNASDSGGRKGKGVRDGERETGVL